MVNFKNKYTCQKLKVSPILWSVKVSPILALDLLKIVFITTNNIFKNKMVVFI